MADTVFCFVDQTSDGLKQRRQIRSHVMKGRNAGRPRPSQRRPREPVRVKRVMAWNHGPGAAAAQSALGAQPLWDDLAMTSFPLPLDLQSRGLLRQWFLLLGDSLYPRHWCTNFSILSSIWVHCMMKDEACEYIYLCLSCLFFRSGLILPEDFHTILAIAASYSSGFMGATTASPKALHHLSKAYLLVNERLSGPAAVSDDALAVVTTLIIYNRVHGQHAIAKVHLYGLIRMIELRGGLAVLSRENPTLALKPPRLDLELALESGSPPALKLSQYVLDKSRGFNLGISSTRTTWWSRMPTNLADLGLDVAAFADTLNSNDDASRLEPVTYSQHELALLHRLVSYAPLGHARPPDSAQNLVHLTLVSIMTGLRPNYSSDFPMYQLLDHQRREALSEHFPITEYGNQLRLWASFIGAASLLADLHVLDSDWLLSQVAESCQFLGISSWKDVRQLFEQLGWFYAVHDGPGQTLWETMEEWQRRERLLPQDLCT